jgi:cobyrinic acid a,c-diamide synthase
VALIIAGDRSGSGKTTVTLALLAALAQRRRRSRSSGQIQSFKVGPDYIDPMFHQRITGLPCRNLDPVLTSEPYVRTCFDRYARTAEYALVEGVMGLFDGAGASEIASTAHIARLLQLPVALVVDCSRLSRSIAAIIHGYRSLDPRLNVSGVVLNRVGSDRHLAILQDAIAALQIPILGVLRRQDEITIRDRHLGLVPAGELPELQQISARLAYLGETCFDWETLEPLLRLDHPASTPSGSEFAPLGSPRVAIAQDDAFNFYYADNLDLLETLGVELVSWSPLNDSLPNNTHGLYLGGGFPEVFAADLSANKDALASVHAAIQSGIPTYAECGGLMYLCQTIQDFEYYPRLQ